VKLNFNKKPIIASYGIVAYVYIVAIIIGLGLFDIIEWPYAWLYIGAMGPMWLFGTIDDIFGSREVGGFRGHFKKLLFERKLTTGALKALGGGVVGLAAGWLISDGNIARWALAAVVIPLAANTLNLLDLRPGRALVVFFFGIGVTCIAALDSLQAPWVVATVVAVALAFSLLDTRGKAMMGDSGSNMLGTALGVTIASSTGLIFQAAAVGVFVLIHWYSEKHSVTALIERNPVLRSIDRRLGVR
jgi:UDP-N-acetylmuramyl pentapeptide phosphotransferase/UDP-N-acetylglucosamine-1-phosphate transferase